MKLFSKTLVLLCIIFMLQSTIAQNDYSTHLKEVTVTGKKGNFLYELLASCRQEEIAKDLQAKLYYELQSYVDNQQVELVEGFYNADITGYDLKDLYIKNGRFALQNYNNRTFASLDGCRIFILSKLFQRNSYFPFSPLEFSKKQLKKYYQLQLDTIINREMDTVWVINCKPNQQTGLFYEGKVWLNPQTKQIHQISLHAKTDEYHPFLPLVYGDEILSVEIYINKSFEEVKESNYFKDLNFDYIIDYKSRPGTEDELTYQIHTTGRLQAYDFEKPFIQPRFLFNKADDYFNISAIPYNDYFWSYHKEPVLQKNRETNELFYHSENTFKNTDLNFKIDPSKNIIPPIKLFVHWSEDRQHFLKTDYIKKKKSPLVGREMKYIILADEMTKIPTELMTFVTTSDYYNLGIKTFMDIYQYDDTTQLITATLMDPDQLFYLLEMDRATECFFNTFFDLVEMKRREFEEQVNRLSNPDIEIIYNMYTRLQLDIEDMQKEYIKDVQLGLDIRALKAWNLRVKKALEIDNVEIFKL